MEPVPLLNYSALQPSKQVAVMGLLESGLAWRQFLAILPVYILQLGYGLASGYPAVTTPQVPPGPACWSGTSLRSLEVPSHGFCCVNNPRVVYTGLPRVT